VKGRITEINVRTMTGISTGTRATRTS